MSRHVPPHAPSPLGLRPAMAVAAALVLLAAPLAAQSPRPAAADAADSARVVGVVEAFHRALAAGDSAAALARLAPGVVILEGGAAETLAEYRAHHLPADLAFARSTRATRSPVRVVVRGDVAWATSTSTVTGSYRGRPVDAAGAELMVLVREPLARERPAYEAGMWRIAAVHWSSRTRGPNGAP